MSDGWIAFAALWLLSGLGTCVHYISDQENIGARARIDALSVCLFFGPLLTLAMLACAAWDLATGAKDNG